MRFRWLSGVLLAGLAVAPPAAANDPVAAARQQFDACQFEQAARTLHDALAQNPRDAGLYYWLGRVHYATRNVDQAVFHAERAVRLEPRNAEYHYWLGRAYGRKATRDRSFGLARRTRSAFEEAVRLDPNHWAAQRAVIDFYLEAPFIVGGGKGKARRQIEDLLARNPAQGHLAQADYWLAENKPEAAAAEYLGVLEVKDAGVDSYLEAARYFLKREDASHTLAAAEAAARVAASDARVAFYRAAASVLSGQRPAEAEQQLKAFLGKALPCANQPSPAEAHEWLGRVYQRLGNCPRAAEEYRRALQLDSGRQSARDRLAQLKDCR
jgi:cytochrome c-type biogenesis protein CcmH/NrfG